MFNFLKKSKNKSKFQNWEFNFISAIINKLPDKYNYLKVQFNKDFIVGRIENPILKNNWKIVLFNQLLIDKYEIKNIKYHLKEIYVYDLTYKKMVNFEMSINDGRLIGYRINSDNTEFDLSNICIDRIQEKSYSNDILNIIKHIFGDINTERLDLSNTFIITIENIDYYVIKEIGDGDYLSITIDGRVFGMFHDPYKIDIIDTDIQKFMTNLNNGTFILADYIKYRLSKCT